MISEENTRLRRRFVPDALGVPVPVNFASLLAMAIRNPQIRSSLEFHRSGTCELIAYLMPNIPLFAKLEV